VSYTLAVPFVIFDVIDGLHLKDNDGHLLNHAYHTFCIRNSSYPNNPISLHVSDQEYLTTIPADFRTYNIFHHKFLL